MHAVDLAIDDFRDHLPSFLQVAQPLNLVHQIGEFRILVYLDPILDDWRDHVRRRPLHHGDIEDRIGVVGERQRERVEVLEGRGTVHTLLAMHGGALLAYEEVRYR